MKLNSIFKYIGRVIKSTLLCIKYPFLYPRNRWTGSHYNCWKIIEYHRNHYKEAYLWVSINTIKIGGEKDKELRYFYKYLDDQKTNYLRIEHDKSILRVIKGKLGKFGESIQMEVDLGEYILAAGWKKDSSEINVILESTERVPERYQSFNLTPVVINSWLSWKIKILDWINDYPLQLIHCLPEYTELDALDKGWRIAFGDDICKEIKAALFKSGGYKALFRYRITQIKEKWGQLEWYCNYCPKEVDDIISKYQKISRRTCIVCGKPAKWQSSGWIAPFCDDCIKDTKYAKPLDIKEIEG